MFVLLNKYCCGGLGKKKWNSIKNEISDSENNVVVSDNMNNLCVRLQQLIENGERNFVAAGGDGTINYLLTNLLLCSTSKQFSEIKFGAIGLGSSKDYFKTYNRLKHINKIPILIDTNRTSFRDLGTISPYNTNSKLIWLNNAGVGVIADANYFFNHPNKLLQLLKKFSTSLAIYFASISTIFKNKKYVIDIESDEYSLRSLHITNLSILKNPHISGSLCYPSAFNPSDGFMQIYICIDMSVLETLGVLFNLTKQRFTPSSKKQTWRTKKVQIKSKHNFVIEYDGETFQTNEVTFSIINNKVQVCTA
ncbi:MAG: hypothetical protein K8F60_04075 [Melioribacteraceae bacterium]|nr:hypothetical protein [Melioribacteraceae bacterium]